MFLSIMLKKIQKFELENESFFRMWYIHNEIPLDNKKEWIANECHSSMNESQKHFAEERSQTQRQQTTRFHLLEIPRKSKTTGTDQDPWYPKLGNASGD